MGLMLIRGKAAESLAGETLRYLLVGESRRSTGGLLHKSRAPHKSPHRGKRSPSRQGSALNPTWEEENGSWNV